ncbi:hypothetical protein JKP88DRAFT_214567 [Tribonema minus]|uniref:Uncharacterized protein n=1 Tax=Tribonema minus TaxID=303371 RepID=A0A836CI98_9STRA|nr:hypothetical protein JKP88DRAFT_214567 [Tribonema minus]
MKGGSDGGYEMGGFTQMDEVESAVPSNGTNGPVLEPVQEECGSEEHEDAAPPPADGEPDADETGMSIPPLNFNDRRDDDDDNDAALLHGHARHAPANGDDVETQALDAGAAFGGGGGGMRAAQREGKENASGDLAFIATAADAAGGLCGKRGSCADDSQDCGMNGGGGGGGALKRPKVGSYQ